MNILIHKALSQEEIQHCLDIRNVVFVVGQGVPLLEEIDGKDEQSEHYLLTANNHPAGTARLRFINEYAKIERVAILDNYQGKGLGQLMIQAILRDLKGNSKITTAKLSSQTQVIPFYEKFGFIVCSDEYMDAGIPHKDMILRLSDPKEYYENKAQNTH